MAEVVIAGVAAFAAICSGYAAIVANNTSKTALDLAKQASESAMPRVYPYVDRDAFQEAVASKGGPATFPMYLRNFGGREAVVVIHATSGAQAELKDGTDAHHRIRMQSTSNVIRGGGRGGRASDLVIPPQGMEVLDLHWFRDKQNPDLNRVTPRTVLAENQLVRFVVVYNDQEGGRREYWSLNRHGRFSRERHPDSE